jgi:hypothetical protein
MLERRGEPLNKLLGLYRPRTASRLSKKLSRLTNTEGAGASRHALGRAHPRTPTGRARAGRQHRRSDTGSESTRPENGCVATSAATSMRNYPNARKAALARMAAPPRRTGESSDCRVRGATPPAASMATTCFQWVPQLEAGTRTKVARNCRVVIIAALRSRTLPIYTARNMHAEGT